MKDGQHYSTPDLLKDESLYRPILTILEFFLKTITLRVVIFHVLSISSSPATVLKFSEVYFNAAGQKVFDVVLNNDHSIVSDLDIYAMVGHGVAYDEVIPFTIADGMLKVQVRSS